MLLVNVLALRHGHDLRDHGVSLISVEGLNFDSFMPLFGEKAITIPVAVLTDADPSTKIDGKTIALYPGPGDTVVPSDTAKLMLAGQDGLVKVFLGKKTFEYDLALIAGNRPTMLAALKELHPLIGAIVETAVDAAVGDQAKAKALFSGMLGSSQNVSPSVR